MPAAAPAAATREEAEADVETVLPPPTDVESGGRPSLPVAISMAVTPASLAPLAPGIPVEKSPNPTEAPMTGGPPGPLVPAAAVPGMSPSVPGEATIPMAAADATLPIL